MKNMFKIIQKWIIKQARSESVLSLIIKLSYRTFSNVYVNVIITFLDTIAIGLMTTFEYYGVFFYITLFLFCACVVLSAWANSYLHEKVIEARHLKQSLYGIDIALRHWAILLQKCAKKLNSLSYQSNPQAINTVLSDIDFQTAAFTVCQDLCDHLSKYYERDDIYITVFQKLRSNGIEQCKMIAYSGNRIPSSYGQTYPIPPFSEELLGKIEYHTYLFSKNKSDISVLPDRTSIVNAFRSHPQSAEREGNIQQYICAPICIAKQGVIFLLQIDTCIENLFGKDETSVNAFAKNAIYPFAQYLHMIYEQGRIIEQLTKE